MKTRIPVICSICLILAATVCEAAETVKIAAIFSITGNVGYKGEDNIELQAARYAVDELNRQGGLLGKPVELIEFDNKSSSIGSKLAAQKAVKSGVIAVVGPNWSSHALVASPILQSAGIPTISPVATNPNVTLTGNYIFRACYTDTFQGTVMARFAVRHLKAGKAVVLTNTSEKYSMGLAQFFTQHFRKKGGNILWEGEYLNDTPDFLPVLEKTKMLQPDVIFLPDYYKRAGAVMKQARSIGISAVFLGGDAWRGKEIFNYGGKAVEGGYFCTHWHSDIPTEKSQQFVAAYEKKYTKPTQAVIPLVYDAISIIADAIRRANSLNPSDIRNALASTRNFPSASRQRPGGST